MRNALWLGAEDILLDQLLDILRATPEALETLFQASVFALPVSIQGLSGALAGSPEPTPAQVEAVQRMVRPLIDSSLLTPLDSDRVWVHRWTAQHLKARMGDARSAPAAGPGSISWYPAPPERRCRGGAVFPGGAGIRPGHRRGRSHTGLHGALWPVSRRCCLCG